jgi:hypothetical protein
MYWFGSNVPKIGIVEAKLRSGRPSANQLDQFISGGQTACTLFRVDLFAIHIDIERARAAGTHPNRNRQLTFHIVLEAHGLQFEIASKEAAFDLDLHI